MDKQLHDLIMMLRQIAIDHPGTLESTQGCIDLVYAIKRSVDHAAPSDPQRFTTPRRKKSPD